MHLCLLVPERTKSRDPESSCLLPYPLSPLVVTLPHTVLREHSRIGGSRERSMGDDVERRSWSRCPHITSSHPHISVVFPLCGTCICMHMCPQHSYLYFSQLVLVGLRVIWSVKGRATKLPGKKGRLDPPAAACENPLWGGGLAARSLAQGSTARSPRDLKWGK